MFLEKNGNMSSFKSTKHIKICFYLINKRINNEELFIDYCTTEDMLGGFFTKPIQGKPFLKFRCLIMNPKS